MPRKKKELSFNDYWGQQIFRLTKGNKDYLWALVRRKYGEDDIERKGIGTHVGVAEKQVYEMETDNDPESVTFGKRVPRRRIVYDTAGNPKEESLPIETRFAFIHEATPANILKYKKLVSNSSVFGFTQFYWVFNNRKVLCENENDFWNLKNSVAKKYAIPAKVSIVPSAENVQS